MHNGLRKCRPQRHRREIVVVIGRRLNLGAVGAASSASRAAKAGKSERYAHLRATEAVDKGVPTLAEVAAALRLTESAVKSAAFRMRQRYRELVREEVAHTVGSSAEIDEELRHLIAIISA